MLLRSPKDSKIGIRNRVTVYLILTCYYFKIGVTGFRISGVSYLAWYLEEFQYDPIFVIRDN